jgi:ATP-dependent helicase Lhr and Lhr-like helicase
LWVAAERLRELRAVLPDAAVHGQAPLLGAEVDRDTALRELIRSRLELQGPVTAAALAAPLGITLPEVETALYALEAQGYVMRGDFSGAGASEWCERRRLARIHRYTRERKRAGFEPVSPAACMRFLLDWQGIASGAARDGPVALEAVLAQLEGVAVAAAAWESEVLPARLPHYDPAWLDQLAASGRIVWQRLPASNGDSRKSGPVRATPILLLPRDRAVVWRTPPDEDVELSGAARAVLDALRAHGASFFVELVEDTGALRSHVEAALGELVSHGLVTSDGFAGLRALVAPAEVKARALRRGGARASFQNLESAGRWSLVGARRRSDDTPSADVEATARLLLRRYGIVFRALIEREARLPPWRELHYVLRRLEARDEIRGGRFVTGFSGEQFALPEAATALRRQREAYADDYVVLAGCDPLNLTGVLLAGERVPALPGNRVLLRDGVAVAGFIGGELRCWAPADAATQNAWQRRLYGAPGAAALAAPQPLQLRTPKAPARPRL